MTTRILLVDDHPAILVGLAGILDADPDLEVVAVEQSAPEALATCLRTTPDVVLLDLSMPGEDGLSVLTRIRRARPEAAVLVLTSASDTETVHRVLQSGAAGYMRKDCTGAELVQAVRAAARGDVPVDPRVTRALLDRPQRTGGPQRSGGTGDLTEREHDVLRLVGQGLANKQIALRLGIGESTVKTHLSSIFQRIGVADRTSAALWARAHLDEAMAG